MGSCRREILDHVIALNEQHLRRLVRDYVSYHHQDRIHDALDKDTPNRRLVERKPTSDAVVISYEAAQPLPAIAFAGSDGEPNRCVYPLFFLIYVHRVCFKRAASRTRTYRWRGQ